MKPDTGIERYNDKVVLQSDFLATTFRFLEQPKNK